jgi:hypothetical protein
MTTASTRVLSFDIGVKNLAYCLFDFSYDPLSTEPVLSSYDYKHSLKIIEWDVITLETGLKKPTINEQSDALFDALSSRFNKSFENVNYIIIENQPVLKNPIMKSIQMMVYSYFKILHLTNKDSSTIKQVNLINAANKLRFAISKLEQNVPNFEPITMLVTTNKYRQTKDASVKYVRELLRCCDKKEHMTLFDTFKKKDDLSDTLLQGLYYIHTFKQFI